MKSGKASSYHKIAEAIWSGLLFLFFFLHTGYTSSSANCNRNVFENIEYHRAPFLSYHAFYLSLTQSGPNYSYEGSYSEMDAFSRFYYLNKCDPVLVLLTDNLSLSPKPACSGSDLHLKIPHPENTDEEPLV